MFDNEFPPLGGGTGVVNFHLFQEFATYPEVTVDLVTSSRDRCRYEKERFTDRITIYKVPVHNQNIHHASNIELIRYSWRGLWQGRRLLKAHRYDLSFAFSGVPAGMLSYALNWTYGLPYLVSLQGPDVPGFEARYNYLYPLLTPWIKRMWRAASAVTAISQDQRDLALRTMSDLSMQIIPNGVDTATFRPSDRSHGRQDVVIVCVARLIARKGQEHLLRAFAALRSQSGQPLRLRLIGTGDDHDTLESLATELGVRDQVEFRGFVPREAMPAIYHESDIFVLPSQQEGMSIALLEAMASGLPVIVTEAGGTAELVSEGENGHIVPWNDVPALTKALGVLVGDAARRQQMGAVSCRRAASFGWPALARRYLDLCEEITRGRCGAAHRSCRPSEPAGASSQ